MTFERGIWAEAFLNAKKIFYMLAIIVVLAVGLSLAQDAWKIGSAGNAGLAFAWLQLAILAHMTILKNQPGITVDQKGKFLGAFFGTSLLLSLGPLLVAALAAAATYKFGEGIMFLSALIVYAVFELLVLAKWGTRYPAMVAGGDRTFNTAASRGNQTFGYVFWRLLVCNAPIILAAFALLFYAISSSNNDAAIWTKTGGLDVLMLCAEIIFNAAFSFQIVLLATILSRAYLIAESKI